MFLSSFNVNFEIILQRVSIIDALVKIVQSLVIMLLIISEFLFRFKGLGWCNIGWYAKWNTKHSKTALKTHRNLSIHTQEVSKIKVNINGGGIDATNENN